MRETNSTDEEKQEEMSFVPSAISVPLRQSVQRKDPQLLADGVGGD